MRRPPTLPRPSAAPARLGAPLQQELSTAREELAVAERAVSQFANRRATLEEARSRVAADFSDNRAVEADAEASLAAIPPLDGLEGELERARYATGRRPCGPGRSAGAG